ncbi:MAG TPA: class I SAM-dependent methyltransferase [Chthoniobacterales bacterium]|nr:class I SAM-dependent methyltransferase [Chthoniobacterales bacterium]
MKRLLDSRAGVCALTYSQGDWGAPVFMSDQNSKSNPSPVQANLDSPKPGQSIYDEAVFLSGWVHSAGCDPASCRIRAFFNDTCFAETRILSSRADVSASLQLPPGTRTGFRMLGKIPPGAAEAGEATLRLVASWGEGNSTTIAERVVRLVPAMLPARPYGEVVFPENERLLHRENIYGSGPPIEEPGVEAANLLREYLPPGSSVVDVGCGAGAYGPVLMTAGHHWVGLEANDYCCEILERRQLTFRRVDVESGKLPCADSEFDCAICIEVLEHTKDPAAFVAEIARSVRQRVLFSVPNLELLPYLHDWGVVPWHLLEGDHKNFFTRGSLHAVLARSFSRIEIFPYGEHPLRTRDDVPVFVHLFAIADK